MIEWIALSLLAATVAGWRATLGLPTRLLVALCGAVLGMAGVPLARLLANPEGAPGVWANVASTSLSILVLCLPLVAILRSRFRLRFSVADGFLLGFLAGWGFDVAVLFARHEAGYNLPANSFWLAPWAGLTGLAAVAGRRFTLYEQWGWAWAAVALAAASAGRLGYLPEYPWAPLAIALLLGEVEARWLTGSPVYRQLKALPDLANPRGLGQRLAVRQIMLERTEMVKMNYTSFPAEVPEPRVAAPPDLGGLVLAVVAWMLVLTGHTEMLWLPALGIAFCFLRFPELEPEDPDGVARVRVEELLVNSSLFLMLVVLLAGVALREVPNFGNLGGVALSIAFAASTLTGSRRGEANLLRSPAQRKMIRVHRLLVLVKSVAIALLCATVFGAWSRLLGGILPLAPWMLLPIAVLLLAALAAMAMSLLNRLGDKLEERFGGS